MGNSLCVLEMVKVSQVGPLLGAARTGCLERQEAGRWVPAGQEGQWPQQQGSSPEVPKHKDQSRSG